MSDNRIRVLHYIPGFRFGGIETVFLGHCRNVDWTRFKFDVLTETQDELPIFEELHKLGCDVYRIKSPVKEPLAYFPTVDKFFKENRGKFDVLHSRCLGGRGASILYYARKYGIKRRIVHIHTTVSNDNRIRRFIERVLLNPICLKLATDRCACGKLAGEIAYGSRPFHWIKNGLDLARFESVTEESVRAARKELGIRDAEKVVGNVGRFCYQKNYLRLVDMFARIHEKDKATRLLLIGAGNDFEAVKRKISDYGLQDAAILPGFRSDVPVLMRAMDMLLLPSRYEGFPNVVTEALASSLRCLISDAIDYPRYDDRVFDLSLKDSDEIWANKVLEILQKSKLDDGTTFIKKSGFDIKDSADDLCSFYAQVIGNNSSQTGKY